MIYVIIGKEHFLIKEKIEELSTDYKVLIYSNNFKEFILDLQKYTNTHLFYNKNKYLVLKYLDKLKIEEHKILIEILKNSNQNFILVFNNEIVDFFHLLRKNKIKYEIFYLKLPNKKEIESFIRERFIKSKIKISEKFIKSLKEVYQDNIEDFLNDLKKIQIVGSNWENIKQIIHLKTNVFKIQDYFLDKNWPLFIHHFKKFILEDKSRDKIETLKTLTLLYNSLIKIYLLKTTNNFININVKDYYLRKLKEKSKKLTLEDIKLLISALAKTDKKFKKFYINIKDIPEDISFNYLLSTNY